jgi:hypothetical protein
MATREEQNNIFFDANGIARPAAEVGADANSAQQLPASSGGPIVRRAARIDPAKYPNLVKHRKLKLPKDSSGRPIETPHVASTVKDEEGNVIDTRDISAAQKVENDLSAKAATEHDKWKAEQPQTAAKPAPKPLFVRQRSANLPAPSRAGDMRPRAILSNYRTQHSILKAHHATLAGAAALHPITAEIHSEIGKDLDAQEAKINAAEFEYSKGRPQFGNEHLLDLANEKSLSTIHSALRDPLMVDAHPEFKPPRVGDIENFEAQAGRLKSETPRRQGKSWGWVNTGHRLQKITPELMGHIRAFVKAGEFGTANSYRFEKAFQGTFRTPKSERVDLPINPAGTVRPGDARVGSERPAVGRGRGASTRGAGVGGTYVEEPVDPRQRPAPLGVGIEGVTAKKGSRNISQANKNLGNPESAIDTVDAERAAKSQKGKKGKKGKK